jgi:uncharacterized protein YndB with AHSA1/START domain
MALKILLGVVLLVIVLVIVVATRPSAFRVERSAVIAAPPERLFERVNDLRAWAAWSPYEKKDPDMKRTFDGPAAGVGATYAWAGDKNIGEGRMTVERSERPSLVGIKLEFFKPFEGTNAVTFTFAPAPGGTKVSWGMDGRYNFVTKGMSMVMDMDKMIGTDFEAGLAALKAQAEAEAARPAPTAASGPRA